ncbi:MAG: hypothetical protein RRY35_08710, partial [Clostridiales bacterium]
DNFKFTEEKKMKKTIGTIGIIAGFLILSLEIFGLQLLQYMEKAGHTYYTNVWRYAGEPPCVIALILTIGVIVFSIFTFFGAESK